MSRAGKALASILLVVGAVQAADGGKAKMAPEVVLVRNATVWTQGEEGRVEESDLLVREGKIVRVGRGLDAPRGAVVVDGTDKHVTPGLIDCHSHSAIRGGVNEGSNNITAEVRIKDAINPDDINLYRQLAGGLTVAHLLHGSANSVGGQDAVIKLRWKVTAAELLLDAPEGIKFALGENPKQSNRRDRTTPQRYPNTRMGVHQSIRQVFVAARDYQREWKEYEASPQAEQDRREPPRRDLQLDAMLEILEGERSIHSHSYRQDEILALMRLLEEFDVTIGTFQHVLEGYKVADELREHGAGASTFSDWWGYKLEAYDAIPHNGALMHDRGVVVTFNSDSSELARRMNLEAAKAVKYGGVDDERALDFVTLNAAKQLGIDDQVGSLEPGKDADFVIWSGDPLSVYSIVEQTWVDGGREFDRATDLERRERMATERAELIERILKGDRKEDEGVSEDEPEAEEPDDAPPTDRAPRPPAVPLTYTDRLASLGGSVSIVGGTVHTMAGDTIENGTVSFRDGRIVDVGAGIAALKGAQVIDAAGKHVYPGLIDANTVVGLIEIGSVPGSLDVNETGQMNPSVNTAIAVNPDSELIPVTRANGLTHALTTPGGNMIRGTSALIRLGGWTWEDLAAATPVAMHVSWPSFRIGRGRRAASKEDQVKRREERLEAIQDAFDDARAYRKAKEAQARGVEPLDVDPTFEAMLPVLDGTIPVIVHASEVKQIKNAIEWAEEEGIRIILVGAGDFWRVTDLLVEKDIPVILAGVLRLPSRRDEPYDTPFTEAGKLHRAGVRFCIANSGSRFGASNGRNLPYHAAMAAAHGLPHDEALRALTLSPARILGVDHALGSIEKGKSASLIVTDGDPLEIRTHVEHVFIDGREYDPKDNKHDRLYERYAGRPDMSDTRPAEYAPR